MKSFLFLPVIFFFASCVTVPCKPAEEVMQEKGVVLECYKTRTRDTKELIDQCLVIDKNGKMSRKNVYKRHCPL